MIKIKVNNVFAEIKDASKEIELIIWEKLSFEVKEFTVGPFHHPKIRHLYNRKTKLTYTGLLPFVIDILNEQGEEYQIIDERIEHKPNADFSLVEYLDEEKTIPLKLRDYQQQIVDACKPREIIQCATGAGKMLRLDTKILTPDGFKELKDIHPNDIIFDEDGNKTTVLAESPVKYVDEYQIEFEDNTYITCCKDHLWKYIIHNNVLNLNYSRVETTEQIMNHQLSDSKNKYTIAIPVNKPIQFDKQDLFLPPYLLGLLLGSGEFSQSKILFTDTQQDILERLQKLIKPFGSFQQLDDSTTYYFVRQPGNSQFKNYILNTFKNCKSTEKFIPQEYLLSSVEDRLALAKGLIDTQGHINTKGHITFYTNSKQLKDDFVFLIRSLGYRTQTYMKDNTTYSIYICGCDNKLFSSDKHQRKFANHRVNNEKYDMLKIVNIKKLDTKSKMKCLTVDSPKHTYICEDFIVTHNTVIMAALTAKFNVKPVAIFADKLSLCTQLQQEFQKFLGTEVGLVGGGIKDQKDITVYSVQSVTEDMMKDVKVMMVDECFVYDTMINLANGIKKPIGELVENYDKQERPYRVATFNIETGERENKNVVSVAKIPLQGKLKAVLIVDANDKLFKVVCTEDHPFYTSARGYVPAKELQTGDKLRMIDGTEGRVFKAVQSPQKVQYVYDLEVEDNHNFYANGVLVHNCHHTPADTISQISRWCKDAYYRVGVSATPWRDDGADMLIDAVFTRRDESKAIDASYLIKRNYLVPCTIYWVHQRQVFKNKKSYNALYTEAIVNNEERNKNIVKIAYQMRNFKDAIILVLIQRVEHGNKIVKMLREALTNNSFTMTVNNNKTGKDTLVRCSSIEFLSGQDDALKRQGVIQAVKERKCNILVASTIADEGLDISSISCVILAGGGKSSTRAFQRVGRALRLYKNPVTGEEKTSATIFDFCDYTPQLRRQARVRDKMYKREEQWDIKNFPDHLLDFDLPKK